MSVRDLTLYSSLPVVSRREALSELSLGALGALVVGSLGCSGPAEVEDDRPRETRSGKIESAHWFLFQHNRLFTAYAHMIGRRWGSGQTYLAHDIIVYNPSRDTQEYILELEVPGYAYRTQRRVTVPARSRVRVPGLAPTFDLPKLYNLSSPVRAEAQLRLTRGGNVVDVISRNMIVEPVNRVRWSMELSGGQKMDVRPMVVTLITPSDRRGMVNRIITESARYMPGKRMVGYNGATVKEIILQTHAIYRAIKARGLVYTNIPGSFFDRTQQVRLPSQSLTSGSANCIDGALLFASVFEALGMEPVLIFVTGHVLVGVRVGPKSPKVVYIETTVLSRATFKQAVATGFNVVGRAKKRRDPNFLRVDVKTLRTNGVMPVSL